MAFYIVPIVKKELLTLWHDYWDSKNPSEAAKKANEDACLGQTALVNARNMKEAAVAAEKQHTGCVAIVDAISKVG